MKTFIYAIVACILIWALIAAGTKTAEAVSAKSSPPAQSQANDVRIGISCGDLRGSGTIIIADFGTGETYQLHFTCPME